MTQYLNPTTMSKDEFLAKHGTRIDESALLDSAMEDRSETCVVVLVDNGLFKAAGIMGGGRDIQEFTDPSDWRPRVFFTVPTAAINAEGGVDDGVVK